MRKSLIIILLLFTVSIFAQDKSSKKKLYKKAYAYFNDEDFSKALPLFLKYDSLYPNNYEIKYNIGACYLNTEFQKTKAIPYLEYALQSDEKNIPKIVFKDLGDLYHLAYRFEDAKKMYQIYLKRGAKNKQQIAEKLKILENAATLYAHPTTIQIKNIGKPVNTSASEITPYISADETVLYYQNKETRDFYLSYNVNDKWSKPVKIDIPNTYDYDIVKLAGVSPDGEQIFVQMGTKQNTDIYFGSNFLKMCGQLIKANENINSPYIERDVSLSLNGNVLYFSSNRPGGYGGFDIYKSEKDSLGEWGPAINLGDSINTAKDELCPFIHPNLHRLYFSSNGYAETMGGFDIFQASLNNNKWGHVKNIGYPINTTYDDLGYTVTAEGNSAYYYSTKNNTKHHFDIYKVYLKESIPLTLVKGKILAGDSLKPIKASIKVKDEKTGKFLKYIYNSNAETGNYLMIFPPGKNYDMIIRAEGYKPYVINIHIPNQTYFYENFQEIHLLPIRIDATGEVLGEKITINNTFYDIYKEYNDSVAKIDSSKIIKYDKLFKVVETLIQTTDTLGINEINKNAEKIISQHSDVIKIKPKKDYDKLFNLVSEIIETTDSVALRMLNKKTLANQAINSVVFYDNNKNTSDTVVLVPDIAINENKKHKELNQKEKLVKTYSIFFRKNDTRIEQEYKKILSEIVQLAKQHQQLYIELIAYHSQEENSKLAIKRALAVRDFMLNKNFYLYRIKTRAASNFLDATAEDNQKVDLKIIESKQLFNKKASTKPIRLEEIRKEEMVYNKAPKRLKQRQLEEKEAYVKPFPYKTNVVYTVQIASGKNWLKEKDSFFKGEHAFYHKFRKRYKYTVGHYKSFKEATQARMVLINKGFADAFVVKFTEGVRYE